MGGYSKMAWVFDYLILTGVGITLPNILGTNEVFDYLILTGVGILTSPVVSSLTVFDYLILTGVGIWQNNEYTIIISIWLLNFNRSRNQPHLIPNAFGCIWLLNFNRSRNLI